MALVLMVAMVVSRSLTTVSQREDHVVRIWRRAGRDCGRRSRRGATDVMCTTGGLDVGESRAVRRLE